MIRRIRKRDGTIVGFEKDKITEAIFKAAKAMGGTDKALADMLAEKVMECLDARMKLNKIPTVEEVQDIVELVLIAQGHAKTAKAFILYRAKRAELRDAAKLANSDKKALMDMIAHKSKLAALIGYDRIESYKMLLFYLKDLQKEGKLPVHPNYLGGSELATTIYQKKYYLKDLDGNLIEDKPEDVFVRIASFLAAVEDGEEKQKAWAVRFYESLYEGHFLPGGRVIAGAGDLYRLKTLANCFVSLIDHDTIDSIYKSAFECARTYSYGGGIGVDISVLRPKGSVVHNASDTSTGSVSFMELFSLTTGLIGQSGRRGALMLTIDIKHPDSKYFMEIKKNPNWVTKQIVEQCGWSKKFDDQQLEEIKRQVRENTQVRFANISLKVTDEFMQAVEEQVYHPAQTMMVYLKEKSVTGHGMRQHAGLHYSFGIPSRPIGSYHFYKACATLDELNQVLRTEGGQEVTEEMLHDVTMRDAFGDLVVPLEHLDLAIHYAGDFMQYYASREVGEIKQLVKARQLWNTFVAGNYSTAEPGLIFWSTMASYSPSNEVGRPIASTNPCGEVPLEDGGACNLGSLNLSRFVKQGYTPEATVNWDGIVQATQVLTRLLDNVVTWNEILNPLEKQRRAATETRRLGLGVMGIADMLNQLGIGYDSEEGTQTLHKAAELIANVAYQTSAALAEEKGASPIFDYMAYQKGKFFREALSDETQEMVREKGLRNIAILSIAPTGTLSSVVLGYRHGNQQYVGVSGGIEPVFALYYTRRSESFGNQIFKVFHATVQAYLDQHNLTETAQHATAEDLAKILPAHFFRTAHVITPKQRVLVQGLWQKYIDHSISSTVNLPEDVDPETISSIYLDAWKHGLKGITIYREGSRFPILSTETEKTAFHEARDSVVAVELQGEKSQMRETALIELPNGVLTTVYHAIRRGLLVKEGDLYRCSEQAFVCADPLLVVEHQGHTSVESHQTSLVVCPSCSKKSMKVENGCYSCLHEECGYSKCDV